jgi:hypothetical protein
VDRKTSTPNATFNSTDFHGCSTAVYHKLKLCYRLHLYTYRPTAGHLWFNYDLRKIRFASELPERKYCSSRSVSVTWQVPSVASGWLVTKRSLNAYIVHLLPVTTTDLSSEPVPSSCQYHVTNTRLCYYLLVGYSLVQNWTYSIMESNRRSIYLLHI